MLNKQKVITEFFVSKGIITGNNLQRALQMQLAGKETMVNILSSLGVNCDENLNSLIIEDLGLSFVDPSAFNITPQVRDIVASEFAYRFRILPLHLADDLLTVAFDTVFNFLAIDYFIEVFGYKIKAELIQKQQMDDFLRRNYDEDKETITIQQIQDDDAYSVIKDDAPVVQLLNMLISDAHKRRASDIHIEPMADKLRIRYRIDGLLQEVQPPAKKLQASIISRVKLLAKMNIAEKRLPQDGRIRMIVNNCELDLRISALPAHHGESVVLRILDKKVMGFDDLGFSDAQLENFKNMINLPNGIILVTGPTGSGKSTTLYAVLNSINKTRKKILTVEDPVEYQVYGVNQVQVKPKIGLSFSKVLRSMLRQAPDVIMVGEIRDIETAAISIQSALTGHLILSTLHTNDACSAVTRLINMGVKPYLAAATLRAVLAQRLIRLLCPDCKEPYTPPKSELRILEFSSSKLPEVLFRAKGCKKCSYTGYLGRVGIFELLVISEKVRLLANKNALNFEIREQAKSEGMMTLKEHAVQKVLSGLTSFHELVRSTQNDVD
ncbi:MAG: type II/IV secretion system protein [Candidatus Omnitrophota bacterium]|nr:MAG: type II/IV secretion system protein [Candidatus Omnitrophota bacterium]